MILFIIKCFCNCWNEVKSLIVKGEIPIYSSLIVHKLLFLNKIMKDDMVKTPHKNYGVCVSLDESLQVFMPKSRRIHEACEAKWLHVSP